YKKLRKTVSINILDFNFVPGDTEFHSLYKIINTATGEDDGLHDIFELHYVELRKFRKEYGELVHPLDRWITFLTKAHELQKNNIPATLAEDKNILKAIEAVDRMFNEEERQVYETRMQALMGVESKIASAEEKGMAQGMAQGMVQGMVQGMAQGMKESLLIILKEKFGVLPDDAIERIHNATAEQLHRWMSRVFAVKTPDELFSSE
ncbi:MAG: Rpn family recombination-promoting nuclease/putative transposase, partial [Candidatus Electrothrix sp. AUS1_2]|nr:Rpn family recombination-promoting nuclease/putative transposase [Candidatus Electrothrix sp. AUS1_2]